MPTVLVVDDESNIIEVLEMAIQEDGMEVLTANNGRDALRLLRENAVDVVVSDIQMPDISGVELLREAGKITPDVPFIMITAFASPETAIEALQHGASDYITKPFRMEELRCALRRALEKRRNVTPAVDDSPANQDSLKAMQGLKLFQALRGSFVIGRSPRMMDVYRTIGTVAMSDSTILITGESGTGKELAARAIHDASQRKGRPFVSINCGAFPETLLESELFGYLKGSFTGAAANRKGLFEAADGGSIFLDEIGEMTPAMQVKLLRVLQERRLRRLGDTSEIPVDVRVIAATNRDLQAGISEGIFREDLYYRIAVITIELPALRERREDIALLADFFMRHYAARANRKIAGIADNALRALEEYAWPGNVRQLENVMERAVALETENEIQLERLPEMIRRRCEATGAHGAGDEGEQVFTLPTDEPFDLDAFLHKVESSLLEQALRQSDGNQTLAAQRLNLTKGSFRHRLHTLQIRP